MSSANPFFYEFKVRFRESRLGMAIRKLNDLALVERHTRDWHGLPSSAERMNVPVGSVIVAINGQSVLKLGYEEVTRQLSSSHRPMLVGFRQLHVTKDEGIGSDRYWQGYLKLRTGSRQWTTRFFILCSSPTEKILASYPNKDIKHSPTADVTDVREATVVHGAHLRQLAGSDLDDGRSAGGYFAVLARSGERLLLKAEAESQALDWVAAFTVLLATEELELETDDRAQRAEEISNEPPVDDVDDSTLVGLNGASRNANQQDYLKSVRTLAVGGARGRRKSSTECNAVIVQGYLWKRMPASSAWCRRWVMLFESGDLAWFTDLPVDANSTAPDGQITLSRETKAVVGAVEDGIDISRSASADGDSWFPFTVQCGSKRLIFRTGSSESLARWFELTKGLIAGEAVTELERKARNSRDTFLKLLSETSRSSRNLLEHDAETAYSLLIGCDGSHGQCTRKDFCDIAGQHFLPLCDVFTAGVIFDALTAEYSPLPRAASGLISSNALSHSSLASHYEDGSSSFINSSSIFSLLSGGLKVNGDLTSQTLSSDPLPGDSRLSFDRFSEYVTSIFEVLRPNESWDTLRIQLGLHPQEILVLFEERVTCLIGGGAKAVTGSILLTDRHVILHQGTTIKVMPLDELQQVNAVEVSAPRGISLFVSYDEALELRGTVHSVDGAVKTKSADLGSCLQLAFWRLSTGSNLKAWLAYTRELMEAHRVSLEAGKSGGKVGSKFRALLSEDLEAYDVLRARLHVWAAANIIRSWALTQLLGGAYSEKGFMPSLLLFTRQMHGDKSAVATLNSFIHGTGDRGTQLNVSTDPLSSSFPQMVSSKWLLHLASAISRSRDFKEKQETENTAFNPVRFRREWDLFWEHLDPVIVWVEETTESVLNWRRPAVSGSLLWLLLSFSWYNSLHLLVPMIPLVMCAVIMVIGSLENRKRHITPGSSPFHSVDAPDDGNILKRVRSMQVKVGHFQKKLHQMNDFLLKLRSLVCWTDPLRTKLFIVFAMLCSIFMMVVPGRVLWAAFWCFHFTKRFRSPDKGFVGLLWEDFWRGLPTLASTHRNFEIEKVHCDASLMGGGGGEEEEEEPSDDLLLVVQQQQHTKKSD